MPAKGQATRQVALDNHKDKKKFYSSLTFHHKKQKACETTLSFYDPRYLRQHMSDMYSESMFQGVIGVHTSPIWSKESDIREVCTK